MSKNKDRFMNLIQDMKSQENIEIYDVEYLEEYWGDEKDKRIHFKIEGLKNWSWGAWLVENENTPYGYEFQIFCQYTRFVDKFKPSRGYFNIQVTPWVDYENETGKKYVSMDLWELGRTVEFIKKHEAMAFCYEDDITKFNGELWAKWHMFKTVASDKWYHFKKKATYKNLHILSAIFGYFKCIKVIYSPDVLNENSHINDNWFVYPCNKIGEWVANKMKKVNHKFYGLGSVRIEEDEIEFLWSAYLMGNAILLTDEKYKLQKTTKNEDGSLNIDENELWAVLNQLDFDEEITIYGEI